MVQKAKIFLADERGVTETEWFRSYHTFNFGNYKNKNKTPVEKLYVLNDDTLAGGKSLTMSVEEATKILLIPIVGAIEYIGSCGTTALINAGEIYCTHLQKDDSFKIDNPYTVELVNFLQLCIKADSTGLINNQLINFNIDEHKNILVGTPLKNPLFNIGKFDGRKETIHLTNKKTKAAFAFVIQGAFELEGILLHARDGVALWNYPQVELEALSNDAIMMLLEIPD